MWLLFSRKTRPSTPVRRVPRAFRPRLESLEDRCLLSGGSLDPTFGNGAGYATTSLSNYDDWANSVLIQKVGKILASGTDYAGSNKAAPPEVFAVARYNTSGSLDPGFGSGGIAIADFPGQTTNGWRYSRSFASALYPQAGTVNDGKIVLVGGHDTNGNGALFALARYNTNGTLDATFGTDKKSPGEVTTSFPVLVGIGGGAHGVVIQSDGKVVVAGASSNGFVLARYTTSGALDSTFGSSGEVVTSLGQKTEVGTLLLQPDGKLIVVGDTSTPGGWVWEMARYNSNGSLDTSFGTGGFVSGPFGAVAYTTAFDAALYASGMADAGKIIVVGHWDGPAGNQLAMARFNPNGALDSTFGAGGEVLATPGSYSFAKSVAIEADAKFVIAGQFNGSGFAVGRYNADGTPDSTFGTGASVTLNIAGPHANSVAFQPNGDIVVAGYAISGNENFLVARYLPSEPQIGSFTVSPNPVPLGSATTLIASSIGDSNAGATITQVTFYYYDSTGAQHALGYGTQTSPGVWTLNYTVNLASGTYTIYAQAEDSYGVFGDPIGLALQVQ